MSSISIAGMSSSQIRVVLSSQLSNMLRQASLAKLVKPVSALVAAGIWQFPTVSHKFARPEQPDSHRRWSASSVRCQVTTADERLVEDVLHFQLVDQEMRALARKKLEGLKGNIPWKKVALVGGMGLGAALAPKLLLAVLGFKGSTFAAGSWAASGQPAAIASGSWFAWAQSTAATSGVFAKLGATSSALTVVATKTKEVDMTDKELLMTLGEMGLFDYEIRNLMTKKLQCRAKPCIW
jgi:hypothetical protein